MREIALFSGKIYTAGTNFTRPPVVTVATNLNSVHRYMRHTFAKCKMFEGFFSSLFLGIPHNIVKYLIYCTHIIIKTTMMLFVHTVFSSGRGQSNLVLPSVSNTSKTIRHPQIWSGNKSLRHYATSHYRLRSGLVGGGLSYLVSSFAASWFASLTGVWYIRWWVPFFLVSLFYSLSLNYVLGIFYFCHGLILKL